MKALTVGELKTNFSEILVQVKNGEKVKVLYGKAKKPVAMIVPIENLNSSRKLGALEGIASFTETGDTKISEEEFLTYDLPS